MKKILICGGHLTPAIALIEELENEKDVSVVFVGRKYATEGSKTLSQEFKTITNKKIKFYPLTAGRLQRKFTQHTIPSILKIPLGFLQSFFYLILIRPNLIVSFGGYLSFPIVFSSWLLGVKSITHEQSVIPGLANKINSIFVEKVYLSFNESQMYFQKEKTKVIGNLIRKSLFNPKSTDSKISKFLTSSKKLIYITGGNQGSHFINQLVFSSIDFLKSYQILHQVGATNYEGDLDKAKNFNKKNYLPVDYIDTQTLGAILNKAQIIVSRSGANTVWELGVFKKPSILIPLPIAAGNEQFFNAKILEDLGLSKILNQKNLNIKSFVDTLNEMEVDLKKYQSPKNNSNIFIKDAAQKLKQEILMYT